MIKKFLSKDFEFMDDVAGLGNNTELRVIATTVWAVATFVAILLFVLFAIPIAALVGLIYQPIWDSGWSTVVPALLGGTTFTLYPVAYRRTNYRTFPSEHGRRVMRKIDRLDSQYRNQLPSDYAAIVWEMDTRGELREEQFYSRGFEKHLDALLLEQERQMVKLDGPQREAADAMHAERRDELTRIVTREATIAKDIRKELGW